MNVVRLLYRAEMGEHEARAVVDLAAPGAYGSFRIVAPDLDEDPLVVGDDFVGRVAIIQSEDRDKESQLEGEADEHRSDPGHGRRSRQLVL